MSGNWHPLSFPNLLPQDYVITSPRSRRYNCIAWALGIVTQWWWPDPDAIANKEAFWPPNVPVECTLDAFLLAYGTAGFIQCADANEEPGYEKIAIYAAINAAGEFEPTHAALQLADGKWTSKLGRSEDISHAALGNVDGPLYGTAVAYTKRLRASGTALSQVC